MQPTFSMFLTDLTRLSSSLSVADGTGVVEKARTAALAPRGPAADLATDEAAVLSMIEDGDGCCWVSRSRCRAVRGASRKETASPSEQLCRLRCWLLSDDWKVGRMGRRVGGKAGQAGVSVSTFYSHQASQSAFKLPKSSSCTLPSKGLALQLENEAMVPFTNKYSR